MAIKISTGLANARMTAGSITNLLNGGFLKIYGGTVPASADNALGGATELCVISDGGGLGGLEFDSVAIGGVLSKNPSQVWMGTNSATGVATFFRFVSPTDTGAYSQEEYRIQGTVGVLGADMNLSNTSLVMGAPQAIQFAYLAQPLG